MPRLLQLLIRATAQGLHQFAGDELVLVVKPGLLSTIVVPYVHLWVADLLLELLCLARVVQCGLADSPGIHWSLELFYGRVFGVVLLGGFWSTLYGELLVEKVLIVLGASHEVHSR